MATEGMNEELSATTSNPNTLAKLAKKQIRQTGETDVRCPKCGTKPILMVTPHGERTIVTCDCGFIADVDINF